MSDSRLSTAESGIEEAASGLAYRLVAARLVKEADPMAKTTGQPGSSTQSGAQGGTPGGTDEALKKALLWGLIGAGGVGTAGALTNAMTARKKRPISSFLTGAALGGLGGGAAGLLAGQPKPLPQTDSSFADWIFNNLSRAAVAPVNSFRTSIPGFVAGADIAASNWRRHQPPDIVRRFDDAVSGGALTKLQGLPTGTSIASARVPPGGAIPPPLPAGSLMTDAEWLTTRRAAMARMSPDQYNAAVRHLMSDPGPEGQAWRSVVRSGYRPENSPGMLRGLVTSPFGTGTRGLDPAAPRTAVSMLHRSLGNRAVLYPAALLAGSRLHDMYGAGRAQREALQRGVNEYNRTPGGVNP